MEKVKQFFKKPFLYLAITILGCALKFTHLDTRLFWLDEISTIMHTSGIALADPSRLPVNEIRHISFYDSLLRMNTQPYTITGQLYGLAADVHLTPGHYAFLIFWQRIVGDSPSDYRLFSVFIFIITLPVLFLFIKELYQSTLAGWIALSLCAVSPFIHLYARDARYYILWSFFFILSNWLILKSIKHNSSKWWIAYSITAVLTLYTSVLSALFVAGHFLYVLVFRRDLLLKYSTCLFLTGLFYSPWLYSIYINLDQIRSAMAWHITDQFYGIIPLIMSLLLGFIRAFIFLYDSMLYATLQTGIISNDAAVMLISDLLILVFIIYSIFFLFRKTPPAIRWFLIVVLFPMVLYFPVIDMYRHSFSSMIWRYHTIIITGIILIAANLFYYKIKEGKLLFTGFQLLLVSLGISSMVFISKEPCIMTWSDCAENWSDAILFSEARNPLLITDFNLGANNLYVILNACYSQDINILFATADLNILPIMDSRKYSDYFLIHASEPLVRKFKNQFRENMIPVKEKVDPWSSQVWRINIDF